MVKMVLLKKLSIFLTVLCLMKLEVRAELTDETYEEVLQKLEDEKIKLKELKTQVEDDYNEQEAHNDILVNEVQQDGSVFENVLDQIDKGIEDVEKLSATVEEEFSNSDGSESYEDLLKKLNDKQIQLKGLKSQVQSDLKNQGSRVSHLVTKVKEDGNRMDNILENIDNGINDVQSATSDIENSFSSEDATETDINLYYHNEAKKKRESGVDPNEEDIDMAICNENPNDTMCVENPGDDIIQDHSNVNKRAVVESDKRFWPNGIVPYIIDESVRTDKYHVIFAAIKDIEEKTGVKWIRKTDPEYKFPHVKIQSSQSGCYSYVGFTGRVGQELNLSHGNGRTCFTKGIVIHEMLHAMGFYHEQSRTDRDKFVSINKEHAISTTRHNFDIAKNSRHCGTYDFGSLMHYGSTAFTTESGKKTIIAKGKNNAEVEENNKKMGQRKELSQGDIEEIKHFYKTGPSNCDKPKCGENEKYNEANEECECKEGFEKVSGACQDIDECAEEGEDPCNGVGTCDNHPGGFTCLCEAGYKKVGNACVDVNECALPGLCGKNADCTNTEGSFTCECKEGFEQGEGDKCEDINECADEMCEDGLRCVNVPGSYKCVDPNASLLSLEDICDKLGNCDDLGEEGGFVRQCNQRTCFVYDIPVPSEGQEISNNGKYFCLSWSVSGLRTQRLTSYVNIIGYHSRGYAYYTKKDLSYCRVNSPDWRSKSEYRDYVFTNRKPNNPLVKLRVMFRLNSKVISPSVNITNFSMTSSPDGNCGGDLK